MVDIGVSAVETCSITRILLRIFFVDSSWNRTLSSLNIRSIFLPWLAWNALFSLLAVRRLKVLLNARAPNPSTSDVQRKNWFQKRPEHQWVKIEEEGSRRWGERLNSPESLSNWLRVSWLAWTYRKAVDQVRMDVELLSFVNTYLHSVEGAQ